MQMPFYKGRKEKIEGKDKIEDPHNNLWYLVLTIIIYAQFIYAKKKILSKEMLTLR